MTPSRAASDSRPASVQITWSRPGPTLMSAIGKQPVVEELELRLSPLDLVLVESGGDNLTMTFSRGLVDVQLFVIDVAGGDKVSVEVPVEAAGAER